jgi:hypothetical protein
MRKPHDSARKNRSFQGVQVVLLNINFIRLSEIEKVFPPGDSSKPGCLAGCSGDAMQPTRPVIRKTAHLDKLDPGQKF